MKNLTTFGKTTIKVRQLQLELSAKLSAVINFQNAFKVGMVITSTPALKIMCLK